MIMLRALERGLSLRDFENLTIGMILDYIICFNNDRLNDSDKEEMIAEQTDFDRF